MNRKYLHCAITDRNLFSGNEAQRQLALLAQASALAQSPAFRAAPVDLLQLREKDLPAAELAALARDLLHHLQHSSTRLLINGRADIAVATAAHGVHLTSAPGELTPRQVHTLYAHAALPAPLVTVSCHSLDEIARQHGQPLTAILFGPVFEKSVAGAHHSSGTGLDLLKRACALAAPTPVLALGGVDASNTDACLEAGAAGVAGIRLFLHPKGADPQP